MKRIGIVGLSQGENSFGIRKSYLEHLKHFGQVIILPPMEDIFEGLDLIVLPGGKDTISANYNEPPSMWSTEADQFQEYFFRNNLKKYIDAGVPVWGTCLGFQQLTVFFGGKLIQQIDTEEHGYSTKDRGEAVHEIILDPTYAYIRGKQRAKDRNKELKVCSLHHQGVLVEDVPECFDVVAKSKDGYAEVIRHKELPIAGSQAHTEEDYNFVGNYMLVELLEAKVHEGSNS